MSWHEGPISQVMPSVPYVIHWSSTLETWVPAMYQDEFTDWIHLEQLKKASVFIETFRQVWIWRGLRPHGPCLRCLIPWWLYLNLSSIMNKSYRSIPLDMIGHTRTLHLCLQNSTPNSYIICRRYSIHSRNASCMMCQPPSSQVATRSERGRSCVSRSCTASGSMKARGLL